MASHLNSIGLPPPRQAQLTDDVVGGPPDDRHVRREGQGYVRQLAYGEANLHPGCDELNSLHGPFADDVASEILERSSVDDHLAEA